MRIEFDEQHDRARLVIVDERQTYEGGYTEAIRVSPEGIDPAHGSGVIVQIGFETPCKLLWVSVEPASLALPQEVLAAAAPRNLGPGSDPEGV